MNARVAFAASLPFVLHACAANGERSANREPDATSTWTDVSLATAAPVSFGGEGDVQRDATGLVLEPGSPLTGVVFAAVPPLPRYELEATAARLSGVDFFCGLTFPTARGCLTLVLGGWGGAVCGLSSLDGQDAANNATRRLRAFATGVDHRVRLVVDGERVTVAIDGEPFLDCDLTGREVDVRAEVGPTKPFGFCCYLTRARLSALRWRPLPASLRS